MSVALAALAVIATVAPMVVIASGPAAAADNTTMLVVATGSGGNSTIMDGTTGRLHDISGTGSAVDTSSSNNYAYIMTNGGALQRYELADGSERWSSQLASTATGQAVKYDREHHRLFAAYLSGGELMLAEVSPTSGNIVQEWAVYSSSTGVADIEIAGDGELFLALKTGGASKVDLDARTIEWSHSAETSTASAIDVAPDDGRVYLAHSEGIHELSPTDGGLLANYSMPGGAEDVEVTASAIFTTVEDTGDVRRLSRDFASEWSVTNSYSGGEIILDNGYVYAGFNDIIEKYRQDDGTMVSSTTAIPSSVTAMVAPHGGDGEAGVTPAASSTNATVTGRVRACAPTAPLCDDGTAVEGATVVAYGSRASTYTDAEQRLEALSDIEPADWEPGLDLPSHFERAETQYPVIVEGSGGRSLPIVDSKDLTETAVQLPADTPLIFAAYDPTKADRFTEGVLAGEYTRQHPGELVRDGSIVVEPLTGRASTSPTTVDLDRTYGGGMLDSDQLVYGQTSLPSGYYRVYVQGHQETSYVVRVGNPREYLVEDLLSSAGDLVPRAQDLVDYQDESLVVVDRDVTGADGGYSISMPDNIDVVYVQAVKVPGSDVDPQQLSVADARQYADTATTGDIEPVYMPAAPEEAEPPASGVDVRVIKVGTPQWGDLESYQGRFDEFLDALRNESLAELSGLIEDEIGDLNDEELETAYQQLDRLRARNELLADRYADLLEERDPTLNEGGSSDASRGELETRLAALQEAMASLESTVEAEQTSSSVDDGLLSGRATFGTILEKEDVTVLAHGSDGSTRSVPREYISIETGVGERAAGVAGQGSSTVVVDEYPVPDGVGAVSLEYLVATEDGVGRGRDTAMVPGVTGEIPALDAIRVSSQQPAVGEEVEMQLIPTDDSTYGSLSSVSVTAPDGSAVSSVAQDDVASWTPGQVGVHRVALTFTDVSGTSWTVVERVDATRGGSLGSPAVRVKDTPYGLVAVGSDGVEAGSVALRDDGTMDVQAQLESGARPGEMHVYTTGVTGQTDRDIELAVVESAREQPVRQHVPVVVHMGTIGEDALVRRDGDAMTRTGSEYGEIRERDGGQDPGTTIETYTGADGTVTLSVDTDPGLVDRARHYTNRQMQRVPVDLPDFDVLGLSIGVDGRGALASLGGSW